MNKSPDAFRTISEVADWLGTPTHVLRFWESRFTQVKPVKRAGGRRYYRPKDMALLGGIKKLLHDDGMTIRGVQKLLREKGIGHVEQLSRPLSGDKTNASDAPEAPIEINAKPEPVENVVPLKKTAKGSIQYKSTGEPERGPRGDMLRGPTDADLGRTAEPAQPKEIAAKETAVAVDQQGSKEELAPVGENAPVPKTKSEPEKPKPFVLKPSDEMDENIDAMPGITGVAAALRAAAKSDHRQKPEPEVFSEIYDRLKNLRDQMGLNASHVSGD